MTYPLDLDLEGRRVVVVGGGRVALRRVRGLLAAGADVTVIAPRVDPGLAGLPLAVCPREYRGGDLAGARVVPAPPAQPGVHTRGRRGAPVTAAHSVTRSLRPGSCG